MATSLFSKDMCFSCSINFYNVSGTILSFDVVNTLVTNHHVLKKVNKQECMENILLLGMIKSNETRKVT